MPTKRNSHSNRHSQPAYPQMGGNFPQNPAYQGAAAYSRNSGNYTVAAQKKMSTGKKVLIAILISLAVILAGGGTAFALYVNHLNDSLKASDEDMLAISDALASSYGTSLDDTFYMMLLGTDNRAKDKGDPGRSDTNIVVRVDPKQKLVSMISIPRDTKIDIKGHGTQKFNAAYAFDGPAGAIRAAEDLLDVEIAHYAEVNFGDLIYLVNAVGGITVENESKIKNKNTMDGNGVLYEIPAGTVHLDGGEALAFARNRDYPDGDFTRQKHQRAVIEAIVAQVLSQPLTAMPGVIEAAVNCVKTDLDVMDIIGLAQNFMMGGDITYYSAMLPSITQTIKGISFVINDEAKTAEMVKLFKEGKDYQDIVSNMTAADVPMDIDTSNVLLYEDDEEVQSGAVNKNTANIGGSSGGGTANNSGGSSGGGNTTNSGGSSGGDSTNTGGSTGGGDTPSGGDGGGDSGETDASAAAA